MNIIGYEFKVKKSENEDDEFINKTDLSSALEIISSDEWLLAFYDLQIEDRTYINFSMEIPYKDISEFNKNEAEILNWLNKKVYKEHKEHLEIK